MSDILKKITAYKREEIASAKLNRPVMQIEAEARLADPVRPFAAALAAKIAQGVPALIAEIKKASPSKGLIRAEFNPPALARAYEAGGAACLSVLTDKPSFRGEAAFLKAARDATALPVLRKDFMLDLYQVPESRAMGADCILIIMACTEDALAADLMAAARHYGMDALIEVHSEEELDRAFALDARLVGINNRDLTTFETSLETTERLAARIPSGTLIVSESGIFTPADIERLTAAGAKAFLVGESLMRQDDVAEATRALLGTAAERMAADAGG